MNFLDAANVCLEILVVVRLWKMFQRAYAGFAIYLTANALTSSLLIALSVLSREPQRRAVWIATELLLVIPGALISWEAIRNIRRQGKQHMDVITVFLAIALMAAIVPWSFSHYSFGYDSALESMFALKATLEFFYCVMIVSMLVTGHIPHRMKALEFRHGVLLAGYFLLNSFTFFAYGHASTIDRMTEWRPLSYFLLATCMACLIGWLWVFRRQRV